MPGKNAGPAPYKTLQQFLHDLAQPLASVTGLVDLLLLELNERDKIFREIQLISEQLEKIMTIIGEIRQIAHAAAEVEVSSQKHPESLLS